MENIKKIIIAIVIIAILLTIVLLSMILNNFNNIDSVSGNEINYEDFQGEYIPEVELKKVSNKNKYFAVKQIVNDYISYISNSEYGAQALEQVLAGKYKTDFNINSQNIKANLSKYAGTEIYIEDMYEQEKSESVSIIIVKGKTKTSNIGFNSIIKIDSLNQAFEIYPEEFMNKYGYNDISKVANLTEIDTTDISTNTYNSFNYNNITNKQMCNYYLEDYVYNVITNIESSYNLLDEEYREKRFGNLDSYKSYVYANLNRIKNVELAEYTTVKYDDYKQYVCIDKEGNYYLFRETDIMEYTILLDTYTVVLPEFVEKYNKAETQEKVALNINNFIQSVNDENYDYAYNVLNETFKSNKFASQTGFETYIRNNLFANNKVEFVEYNVENNTYVYTINISDANSDNSNKISMTVIMQLGSGTTYTMSFSIN